MDDFKVSTHIQRTEEILNPDINNPNEETELTAKVSLDDAISSIEDLKYFLATAPMNWHENQVIRRYYLSNSKGFISCVFWDNLFYITGTDIVKTCAYKMEKFGRKINDRKKFEEGLFSDLRNLKCGVDATLEQPKSKFLKFLYRNLCLKTQKKRKVFFWFSVPHERLFADALERDLKKEHHGNEASTIAVHEPAVSFKYDPKSKLPLEIQISRYIASKKCQDNESVDNGANKTKKSTLGSESPVHIGSNKKTITDLRSSPVVSTMKSNNISSLNNPIDTISLENIQLKPESILNCSRQKNVETIKLETTTNSTTTPNDTLPPLPISLTSEYSDIPISDCKSPGLNTDSIDDNEFFPITIEYQEDGYDSYNGSTLSVKPLPGLMLLDDNKFENNKLGYSNFLPTQFSPLILSSSLDQQLMLPNIQRTPFGDLRSSAKDSKYTISTPNGNSLHFPNPEALTPTGFANINEFSNEIEGQVLSESITEKIQNSQESPMWNIISQVPINRGSHLLHPLYTASIKNTPITNLSPFLSTTTGWAQLNSPFLQTLPISKSSSMNNHINKKKFTENEKTIRKPIIRTKTPTNKHSKPNTKRVVKKSIDKMIEKLHTTSKIQEQQLQNGT
ncbi:Protein STE12 [Nakaseomyces bracarensis]|uniref:Protein STE12 n=1 Tax=Nakaseomyces bracarensis TaxID=273131 RepID=A0ABR4NVP5_9SACH